ncbi:Cold shock domain-containing protein E1 [Armadillidium vulgare]|nr:Cold shock domain-containing protein E1 [Armadillidium vulgare]
MDYMGLFERLSSSSRQEDNDVFTSSFESVSKTEMRKEFPVHDFQPDQSTNQTSTLQPSSQVLPKLNQTLKTPESFTSQQSDNKMSLNLKVDGCEGGINSSLSLQTPNSSSPKPSNGSGISNSSVKISSVRATPVHQGFIATLKDSFGFIETLNHDKEIFFHFSNLDGNANDLDLGQEVEYTISSRTGPGGKLSAENVKVLPVGSLTMPKILGKVYEGTVLRSMRSVNPDQQEYCGLVCVGKEDEKLGKHQFGITGLVSKKELLQPGDMVTFQLDEDGWAVNIRAIRKKLLATVETIKGQYGFLNYGSDEGKRLFFHQSEVKDNVTLSPGDEVQFVVITNLKTGKSSACNITRILTNSGPSQRPDRLVSKLKSLSMDTSKPRIQVIRKPRGPDGTKGFKVTRHDLPT